MMEITLGARETAGLLSVWCFSCTLAVGTHSFQAESLFLSTPVIFRGWHTTYKKGSTTQKGDS